jgi:hypothetical protein
LGGAAASAPCGTAARADGRCRGLVTTRGIRVDNLPKLLERCRRGSRATPSACSTISVRSGSGDFFSWLGWRNATPLGPTHRPRPQAPRSRRTIGRERTWGPGCVPRACGVRGSFRPIGRRSVAALHEAFNARPPRFENRQTRQRPGRLFCALAEACWRSSQRFCSG